MRAGAWTEGLALLLLLAAVLALFTPLTDALIVGDIETDYYDQILDARSVLETGHNTTPRPNLLFNRALVLLAWPLAGDLAAAALLVSVAAYALTAGLLYGLLRGPEAPRSVALALGLAGLALGLLVAAPLFFLLGQPSEQALNGYLTFSVYHNPSSLLAKLLALPQMALALRVLRPVPLERWRRVGLLLAGLLVTALSMMAKFSFSVALLPALLLLALGCRLRGRAIDEGLLLVCLTAAGLLLLGQYGVFAAASDSSTVSLDFLGYYRAIDEDLGLLPLKWLASLAFPLGLLLLVGRAAWANAGLGLAWLTFGVAWVQAVLFVEEGWRIAHGNFSWGALYAAFVLFAFSLRYLLAWPGPRWRVLLALALFGLHILAGLAWFMDNLAG